MGGVGIKIKVILTVFIIALSLGSYNTVLASNGEIYNLSDKSLKYPLNQLANLKNQLEVGLHSSRYGYEYDGKIYKLEDVNQIYSSEINSGNNDLDSILEKVKLNCEPSFIPDDSEDFDVEEIY